MIYSAIKQFSKVQRHGLFIDDELEEWAVQDEDSDALSMKEKREEDEF